MGKFPVDYFRPGDHFPAGADLGSDGAFSGARGPIMVLGRGQKNPVTPVNPEEPVQIPFKAKSAPPATNSAPISHFIPRSMLRSQRPRGAPPKTKAGQSPRRPGKNTEAGEE